MTSAHGPLADELAAMPGVWRRLLAAHVPDRLGRCAGCRTSGGSGARWPCSLHDVAARAERLHGLRLGRQASDRGEQAPGEPGQEVGGE